MMTTLNLFMSGALAMACATSGMFFLRFWRQTRDSLFWAFALAFFLLAIERVCLIAINAEAEGRTFVYLFRLSAYILIIRAIVIKNRPERQRQPS